MAVACLVALLGCSLASAPAPAPAPSLVEEPLPTSRPPRTGVVVDHVLTYPDGRRVQLARGWGVTGIARYGDGYLVADNRYFEGTVGMQRLDADGLVVESWTSTGSPLVAPDGQVAWVSMIAPESGETGPTLIHVGERTQELTGMFSPYLQSFDGETVTFSARTLIRGRWPAVTYATDLVDPPRRIGTAPHFARYYSPSGQNWYGFRRRSLLLATPQGETSIPARSLIRTWGVLFWEDDQHLLGTYARGGRMAVARIDLSGSISIASPWRRRDLDGFAFLSR